MAAVGLRKAPPRTLVISIVEKSEAALYRRGGELDFIDRDGQPDRPLRPARRRRRPADPFGRRSRPGAAGGDVAAGRAGEGPADLVGRPFRAGDPGRRRFSTVHRRAAFPVLVRAGTLGDKTRDCRPCFPRSRTATPKSRPWTCGSRGGSSFNPWRTPRSRQGPPRAQAGHRAGPWRPRQAARGDFLNLF